MNEVVLQDGNTIIKYPQASLHHCKKLCDQTTGCESFTYCQDNDETECYLKDQTLTGTERTKNGGTCASYYKSPGNSIDIIFDMVHSNIVFHGGMYLYITNIFCSLS